MIYILARATGWQESDLLAMPYAKALMYLHCHMLYQGSATRWAYADDAEAEKLESDFKKYLKR